MAEVIWPADALDQLHAIVACIRISDPTAAEQFHRRLSDLGDSLVDFPNRGRPISNGIRELVTVPPFVMRYRVVGTKVFILGIRHGARRPIDD